MNRYSALRLATYVLPLVFVSLSIVSAQPSPANADGPAKDSLLLRAKTLIDEGTNRGSIESLKQARTLAEQTTGQTEYKALAHYYAGLASYRLSNQLPEDAEEKREQWIETAIRHLRRATEADAEMADAWALLAGSYGQLMGMNPMQAMSLSPKADEAMRHAKSHGPKNPRVWIIDGTQDFFTPSMFGGDKERALEKFERAGRLAEQETVECSLCPTWGHAEAHVWIGIAHMEAERYDQARAAFEAALEIKPDYAWVKEELLPRLEEAGN